MTELVILFEKKKPFRLVPKVTGERIAVTTDSPPGLSQFECNAQCMRYEAYP